MTRHKCSIFHTLPLLIHNLLQWVHNEGFVITKKQRDGVNDQFAEYSDGRRLVDLTVDRGDWSIGIGLVGMQDTYHPDEWEASTGRFDLAGQPSDLERQVGFITSEWAEAISMTRKDQAAEAQIRAIGVDFMRRRFGERSSDR